MTDIPYWDPDWVSYTIEAEGQKQTVHVDQGLDFPLEEMMEELPYLMHLRLHLPAAASDEESEKAEELLDQTVESMLAHQCVYAGRRDTGGQANFFFYGESEQRLKEAIEETLPQLKAYEADFVIRHEPEWETYRNSLLPDDLTEKIIYTDQARATLEEEGFEPGAVQEVVHLIFFKTEKDRAAAELQLKDKGYSVEKTDYYDEEDFEDIKALARELESEEEEENPPGLRLTHKIALNDPKLYDHVRQLHATATAHDGFYDSWGILEE